MEYTTQPNAVRPRPGISIPAKVWSRDFEQLNTEAIVPCEVVFGSPKMDCRGTGICKLMGYTGATDMRRSSCKQNPGFLIPYRDGKSIALVFRRELLCVNVLRTHFRQDTLTLKDNFDLPPVLVEKLGLCTTSIKAGAYRLETFGGHYLIQFRKSDR